MVPPEVRGVAGGGPPVRPPLRGGELRRQGRAQRAGGRRARGRFHALLVRGDVEAAARHEHGGGAGGQHAPARGGADLDDRLVELRRPHAPGAPARPARDVRARLPRAARPRLAAHGRRLGAPGRPAVRPGRRDPHPGGARRAAGAHRRRRPRGVPVRRRLAAVVARHAAALRRRDRRRDRPRRRPDRLPHDRGARDGHPVERRVRLPARHLRARGGAAARRARLEPRGRAHAAGMGEGAGRQLREARALPPQRDDRARGRPPGGAGLGRDPGLLDDRLVRSAAARQRAPAARRDDRPRPQPRVRGPVVGRERDAHQRAAQRIPAHADPGRAPAGPDAPADRGAPGARRGRHARDRRPDRRGPRRDGQQRVRRLVRRDAREVRPGDVPVGLDETARDVGVRRGRPRWLPGTGGAALHRGLPGAALPEADRDAQAHPVPARHGALDPDGLPLAATSAARHPGGLEPQGPGVRARPEEAGVRRGEGLLRGAGRGSRADETPSTMVAAGLAACLAPPLELAAATSSLDAFVADGDREPGASPGVRYEAASGGARAPTTK